MDTISAFFMRNIVFVYFFYGLAFFALGLVVMLESGRATEFRFARALIPLALFGFVHGAHEWFEMYQILAAHGAGQTAGTGEEMVGLITLVVSFLFLLSFGTRLLPDAERRPRASLWQVLALALLWGAGVFYVAWHFRPTTAELLSAADVLARYSLGIPGALLAAWALLRERRDFHLRGMSAYGRDLLWAALALFVYGAVGQAFTRPSLVWPSQTINTALFLRTFGIPIQLLRGLAAIAIAITLGRALRAFEQESRVRLARANKMRLEAQASALDSQARRTVEVEALNVQLQATTGELSAMVELSLTLSSTMDLQRLLSDALGQIVRSFDGAGCGIIFLKRPDGGLELAGEYRRPDAALPYAPPPLTATASTAFDALRPAGEAPGEDVQVLAGECFAGGRRYRTLGVPLQAKGQLLGTVALASEGDEVPFGADEMGLLVAFAQQIAATVENARLYQVVQERETQLEELVHKLVNAQESERQRIARELHDETGQKLTALAMGLAAVETQMGSGDADRAAALVRGLRDLSDQAITELRKVMANLRPSQLDDLGLVPALRWYVQQYAARHPELTITMTADRFAHRLPSEYETVLFRVAQEALSNVSKHASATQVTIALCQQPGQVWLEVRDNGMGFDVGAPARLDQGSGWGLIGMRERVALAGGKLTLESQRGRGTHLRVELPHADVAEPNAQGREE